MVLGLALDVRLWTLLGISSQVWPLFS